MCVPYSFAITASGEIFDGKNLEHHTDICAQNDLEYDHVLKPEFQIWNKQLKDMEPTLDYFTSNGKRCAFMKDGMLKEKFYRIAENHINKKFSNWMAGLEYFEENWDIVSPYAPQLAKNVPMEPIQLAEPIVVKKTIFFEGTAQERIKWLNDTFDDSVSIKKLVPVSSCERFVVEFRFSEFCCGESVVLGDHYLISCAELMQAENPITLYNCYVAHVKRKVYAQVKHVLESGTMDIQKYDHTKIKFTTVDKPKSDWTFNMFMEHWSKKENRVPCWA